MVRERGEIYGYDKVVASLEQDGLIKKGERGKFVYVDPMFGRKGVPVTEERLKTLRRIEMEDGEPVVAVQTSNNQELEVVWLIGG